MKNETPLLLTEEESLEQALEMIKNNSSFLLIIKNDENKGNNLLQHNLSLHDMVQMVIVLVNSIAELSFQHGKEEVTKH